MLFPNVIAASALLLSSVNAIPLIQRDAPDSKGAVASESSICSQIGIDLIAQGGNAADALVGTVFCIGVVGMYHSGIGGGGFMLVRRPNATYEMVDFRETAPAAAFQDMYNGNINASIFGGLASGVPGEIRGLQHVYEAYGTLPWKTIMQGAIDTARNGWNVTHDLVRYIASANASALVPNFLCAEPDWAIDFCPNGTIVGLGDVITRRRYADTLETIANEGPDAFYTGAIAEATIAALQAQNGTMTLQDLANYTAAIRETGNVTFGEYIVHSTTCPSSGTVVLNQLNTLSGYQDFFAPDNISLSTHLMDEAIRFGYGARTDMGDPSFVANMSRYEAELLLPVTGADIRAKISDTQTFNVSYYDPQGIQSLETPGTSAIVTSDASGLSFSLTTTVNLLFGSNLIVPATGVIMNNEMNDFSVPGESNAFGYIPSPANYIVPGKRPLSSISPIIVDFAGNNSLYFITSSAGGSRIITANLQDTIHVLSQNMSALEALAQPRLHDQLVPNQVSFEWAYDNTTVAYMKSLGCNVTWIAPGQSSAQAILRLPNGTFTAAGEPRQLNSGGFAI